MAQKTLIEKLADRGEEALSKIAENPVAHRALDTVIGLKERVDDMTKRVSGLERMEKRLATLERRLAKLEESGKTAARRTTTGARTTARKTATSARSTARKTAAGAKTTESSATKES